MKDQSQKDSYTVHLFIVNNDNHNLEKSDCNIVTILSKDVANKASFIYKRSTRAWRNLRIYDSKLMLTNVSNAKYTENRCYYL